MVVAEPRFVADSAERLVELAQAADPPVREGERAELLLGRRKVLLEARLRGEYVEWIEVER